MQNHSTFFDLSYVQWKICLECKNGNVSTCFAVREKEEMSIAIKDYHSHDHVGDIRNILEISNFKSYIVVSQRIRNAKNVIATNLIFLIFLNKI